MIKQKIVAVILILLTVPGIIIDKDLTATVFMSTFAVPLFFSKDIFFH